MSLGQIVVTLSQGNINNGSLRLRPQDLDFFPPDAIGPPSLKQGEGALLALQLTGLPDEVRTDIAGDKRIFRRRGLWKPFFELHKLAAGDKVVIERLSEYGYRVAPGHDHHKYLTT